MLDLEELLDGFTPPRPYTMEAVADAPPAPGVHVVLDAGSVVYVGYTGNLRSRLRQHLTGNRGSSVLHDQIAHLFDTPDHTATTDDVVAWLGRRELRWQETDDPKPAKETLVRALQPCFNRQIPKPR
ncbi:GIY-YIG nuclease family protein [Micromonosporaceae bacterium DT194]|uniref:GIY-YIG nuclease family protein n=1 Tax=Melissospora conviva TaxID=3388432 RepID=UPI003C1B7D0F